MFLLEQERKVTDLAINEAEVLHVAFKEQSNVLTVYSYAIVIYDENGEVVKVENDNKQFSYI